MEELSDKIKNIIIEEYNLLIKHIEKDFKTNYNKKRYNFLIDQLEENIIANMVFVSSFESKYGFAIETCAERIASLKFGEKNVPKIVNPLGLKHNLNEEHSTRQIIVSNVDLSNGDLKGKISAFRANHVAKSSETGHIESGVNQNSIKKLIDIASEYKDEKIHTKPVDLAFFDGTNWIVMELKAGGNLDSSNAPSNVEKLLTIYSGLQVKNSKAYFATLYNKDGEGNNWKGSIKKHMAYPEMFLIGKNFWNTILPGRITYEEFEKIYKKALIEIDLNKQIKRIIENLLK